MRTRPILLTALVLALACVVVSCATTAPSAPTVDDRLLSLSSGILATQNDYVTLSAANKVTAPQVVAWNDYVRGAQVAVPALTNQWRAIRDGSDAAAKATVAGQLTVLESRYAALKAVADAKK